MGLYLKWQAQRANARFVASREKRPLSGIERAIIDMAISTMKSGERQARAQLAAATYGGLAHPGDHVCFMIDVPDDVDLIPQLSDVLDLDVDSSPDNPLEITLFIERGRLDSVDLTTYVDDSSGTSWPALSRIHQPPRC